MSEAIQPVLKAQRSYDINRWLALCGVVGPIMFVLAFTVAGAMRTGYSPIHQAISDLGVGPNPWLLNGPLIIMGLLLIAFSVGFFRSADVNISGRWRWGCAVLLALPGLGYLDAGVFTEAPATVALHWMIGMPLITVGSVVGFFVVGLKLRRDSRWRGLSAYSMIAGPATLLVIAAMDWTWTPGTPMAPLQLGGLMERVLFVEILAWYVVFGWRLFRGPRLAADRPFTSDTHRSDPTGRVVSMPTARVRMPIAAIIWIEALAFFFAALLHTGVRISVLPEFFNDPTIVGATVVEGMCGVFLALAAFLVSLRRAKAWGTAVGAHVFSITADVFGMILIAVGASPDSPFNFLFHRIGIAILAVVFFLLFTRPARGALE